MKQEKGNWKPYNVKAIASNVESVFKHQSISKLNNPTYNFISLHMGFIAHYGLGGFQSVYEDLREFALKLQTSEYSYNTDHNLHEATRIETDSDFKEWYGDAYNKSKAEAIRKIVEIARKYSVEIDKSFGEKEKNDDLALASTLASKHGYKLEKGE